MSEIACHIVQEYIAVHKVRAPIAYHVVGGDLVTHIVQPITDASAGPGPAPTIPVNTVAPSIPATLETGVEATASAGTWTDAITVTGAWWLDGAQVATGYTYTPPSAAAAEDVFFRETAVNGAESATADSATRTVLYNPVVIPDVEAWATMRRASGLAEDDPVQPIPEVINGWDFTAPTTGQAPLYKAGVSGGPPGAQFDGSDDVSEHLTPANFGFLYGGPSTIGFVLDGPFTANQYFWSQGTASANGYGIAILFLASGTLRYYLSNGSGTYIYFMSASVSPTAGRHSFFFTQDLTDCRFYYDGVLHTTLPVSGSPAYSAGASTFSPRFSNTVLEMALQLNDGVFASRKLGASEILSLDTNLRP
jgi:hypothetical protein